VGLSSWGRRGRIQKNKSNNSVSPDKKSGPAALKEKGELLQISHTLNFQRTQSAENGKNDTVHGKNRLKVYGGGGGIRDNHLVWARYKELALGRKRFRCQVTEAQNKGKI